MGGFRCAGWARNPKGPQVTPFRHQMGRHPTIWDFKTGIRHRIPARISPWESRGPNPNFLSTHFGLQNAQKLIFWEGFEFIRAHSNGFGAPGAQGAPRGPKGPKGPKGAQGPPPVGSHWPPYRIYLMTTSVGNMRGGWPKWPFLARVFPCKPKGRRGLGSPGVQILSAP